MNTRLIIRLVFLCLFLVGCSFPGIANTSIPETPTPEVIIEISTSTIQPTNTYEVVVTDTPVPSQTPELPLIPSPTPFPAIWYTIQPGTPLATVNTPHEAAGCSWLGVGGQVFGSDTAPVLGLNILVAGTLDTHQVVSLGITGMETNIGEGGYEVTLADHPIASTGTLWIQIVDESSNPLSDKIIFDTFDDCERNFILVNFVRYSPSAGGSIRSSYLPFISKWLQITPTP